MFDVLDVFGASCRIAETWRAAGYRAFSYDIKLSKNHDICTEDGFKLLLWKTMQSFGLMSWIWIDVVGC